MHPAYSVIFFTTSSGAGYGLLAWLGVAAAFGLVPTHWAFGFVGLGIALALVTAGLLSSTFHLGRPERAWRAFSQWQSSWLSREGVFAVLTYIPSGLLGLLWVFTDERGLIFSILGLASAVLAVITIYTTGMIYGSLPTIRAWYQPLTAPVYILLGLASGGVLFHLVLAAFVQPTWGSVITGIVAIAVALIAKRSYWSEIDTAAKTYTTEAATGLGKLGKVRPLDPPHSTPNFVMREMGYSVARKHAEKLRGMAMYLAFLMPVLCLALLPLLSPMGAVAVAFIGVACAAVGLFVERWLFFAEAEHVVMVFYGRERA